MGAVERWNHTLKDMLSKNAQEHGSDWDVHLPFLLFAYRGIPHSTRGMSPFLLVYGRLPTDVSLLKEVWVGEKTSQLLSPVQWKTTIIEITRTYSAKVELDDGGGIRELHFHKLRPYIARVGQVGLIFDQDSDFGDLHYAPTDMAVTSMGDITDHISSDCQELEDVQRLELLNTLKKFSSLLSSLPGLAKVKGT
ncbi:retrovirus-related Pol polyprotein from transposon opus [Trichonephila clavipes]|nr:retrovirus-related Pol polyprotein from transposon opus [Trichonephila clavipes]